MYLHVISTAIHRQHFPAFQSSQMWGLKLHHALNYKVYFQWHHALNLNFKITIAEMDGNFINKKEIFDLIYNQFYVVN